MTAQVIFLNQFYYPSQEEQARLDWLQEQMELYNVELAYLSRDFTAYQKFIFKERSHWNTRMAWRLIDGEID